MKNGLMDGCTTDGHTDTQTVQRETIIPHHYCVAGYKRYMIMPHFSDVSRYMHIVFVQRFFEAASSLSIQ